MLSDTVIPVQSSFVSPAKAGSFWAMFPIATAIVALSLAVTLPPKAGIGASSLAFSSVAVEPGL